METETIIKSRVLLDRIVTIFLEAPREGRDIDNPEGSRTIRLSETLVNELIDQYIEVDMKNNT